MSSVHGLGVVGGTPVLLSAPGVVSGGPASVPVYAVVIGSGSREALHFAVSIIIHVSIGTGVPPSVAMGAFTMVTATAPETIVNPNSAPLSTTGLGTVHSTVD